MQEILWFSRSTRQSFHMRNEERGQRAGIFDGQRGRTMPCKGLRVWGLLNKDLELCRRRMLVVHYQRAELC
jgi:hypothetical protein